MTDTVETTETDLFALACTGDANGFAQLALLALHAGQEATFVRPLEGLVAAEAFARLAVARQPSLAGVLAGTLFLRAEWETEYGEQSRRLHFEAEAIDFTRLGAEHGDEACKKLLTVDASDVLSQATLIKIARDDAQMLASVQPAGSS